MCSHNRFASFTFAVRAILEGVNIYYMKRKKLADMKLDLVADMEVDKVADKVADTEVDKVANMFKTKCIKPDML